MENAPAATAADTHRPVMALNHTGHGIGTVIGCSCGEMPAKGSLRGSTQHVWFLRHARKHGVADDAWAPMTYATGRGYPAEGMTWDDWCASHRGMSPFTGSKL